MKLANVGRVVQKCTQLQQSSSMLNSVRSVYLCPSNSSPILFSSNSTDFCLQNRCLSTTQSTCQERRERKLEAKNRESDSFIMNMFAGNCKLDKVFPYPDVVSDDQREMLRMLIPQATKLYNELNDPLKNDQNESVDEKVVERMKEIGAFGVMVPAEYEGADMSATQFARLGEVIGGNDLGISVFLGAHQSIGYKGLVLFGTKPQKDKYLADLATGRRIAAFCLTEPGSGSDASSIKTRAVLSADGKHWILNGSKIWISNGGIADVMTVFAKTTVKHHKTGEDVDKVTAFFVERAFGGVTNGPAEKKMGIKCSNTTEVYFENVKVPVENVLGQTGDGFKVAMNILNSGRFGMIAALTGSMRHLISKATEHATNRVQFGSKISTYGSIQEKIARMTMLHYVGESLAYMVAGNMDRGAKDFQLEAAVGKIIASESAWAVADETIQIMGGMGYMRDAGVEKFLRDIRIFRIFEGTNDILRLFISLTGLQYTGSHLKELQRAMKNPVANLGMIFDQGTKRVFRAVGISTGPGLAEHVAPALSAPAAQVSKSIQSFAGTVEQLLVKYNKDIIHEQMLLNNLANAAIDIYISTVLLSRATNSINRKFRSAPHEILIVNTFIAEAMERVEQNLAASKSPARHELNNNLKQISDNVCSSQGIGHVHPIDQE
jgi:very long chain acyl-CoA dehydrogenase